MPKYQFVNPYNFIPLTGEKQQREQEQEENTLSGAVEYSVLTKTPLFIPNTSSNQAFELENKQSEEHKSFDFFSYENLSSDKSYNHIFFKPVIPGSEIRGMFRSNYEILTESCMSALDHEAVLSKRIDQVFKAGLLHRNKDKTYDLYEAEDLLWRTKGKNNHEDETAWKKEYFNRECYIQDDFLEGSKVYFRKENRKGKPLARGVKDIFYERAMPGFILKGEEGPPVGKNKKHACHIFALKSNCLKKGIPLTGLERALKEYARNGKSLYTEYSKQLEAFKEGKGEAYFPVYYDHVKEGHYFLSPASITREVYKNQLQDIVRTFCSCNDKDKLCPTCFLFGTVGKEFAMTSKIRFSDLQSESLADHTEYYNEIATLQPLSGPKLNSTEFYLKRPEDAQFWTYDYYVDGKQEIHLHRPEIAGRKFYWHQMGKLKAYTNEKTKLNMSVRPVKPGVYFHGKVYFHKITEKELQQLIYLINTGEDGELEKKSHGYKLGAAKPLGFGSIACCVDKVMVRKIQKDDFLVSYVETEYKPQTVPTLFSEKVIKAFAKMTDFYAVQGQCVCYPGLQNGSDSKGYEWFTNNRPRKIKRRKEMYFKEYMVPMQADLKKVSRSPSVRK